MLFEGLHHCPLHCCYGWRLWRLRGRCSVSVPSLESPVLNLSVTVQMSFSALFLFFCFCPLPHPPCWGSCMGPTVSAYPQLLNAELSPLLTTQQYSSYLFRVVSAILSVASVQQAHCSCCHSNLSSCFTCCLMGSPLPGLLPHFQSATIVKKVLGFSAHWTWCCCKIMY